MQIRRSSTRLAHVEEQMTRLRRGLQRQREVLRRQRQAMKRLSERLDQLEKRLAEAEGRARDGQENSVKAQRLATDDARALEFLAIDVNVLRRDIDMLLGETQ